MKLMVTGGAGFIGSAVVRLAVSRGHQVVNVDALTYAACLDNVASVADSPDYAFEQADIRDRAAMDRVLDTTNPTRSCTWPPKAMSTGPSTGRGPSSIPT
jgi:dTDP-glucose 4,6-dehydratase